MGDRLRPGKPTQYFTSQLGQLSLLSSIRQEISTGFGDALQLGIKNSWFIAIVDKRVGGR